MDETKYWAIFDPQEGAGADISKLSSPGLDDAAAVSTAQSIYGERLFKVIRQVGETREELYVRS